MYTIKCIKKKELVVREVDAETLVKYIEKYKQGEINIINVKYGMVDIDFKELSKQLK